MNITLIFCAVLSLVFMTLIIRKSASSKIIKVIYSLILLIIAFVCFANVYGLLGGIITGVACLMCVGLLTAFITGKALKGY